MKRINGKQYIEVVGMESTAGTITSNELRMTEWMSTGQVRRCIDRDTATLLKSTGEIWRKLAAAKVVMYYCQADRSHISALDITKSYMLNGTPVTAYELIMLAQKRIDRDIFDTKLAAKLLSSKGYRVAPNPRPTNKYEI